MTIHERFIAERTAKNVFSGKMEIFLKNNLRNWIKVFTFALAIPKEFNRGVAQSG